MAFPTGRALLDAHTILRSIGLQSDMHYADFGAGGLGHFVFPAATIVGKEGLVYAVDILKPALDSIERRARDEQVDNLRIVWGDLEVSGGISVPEESLDIASYVNVASVLKRTPKAILESLRLLKSGGRLTIMDWKPGTGSIVVPDHKRLYPQEIQSIAEQAGLLFLKSFDAGPQHWGLLFKKA